MKILAKVMNIDLGYLDNLIELRFMRQFKKKKFSKIRKKLKGDLKDTRAIEF